MPYSRQELARWVFVATVERVRVARGRPCVPAVPNIPGTGSDTHLHCYLGRSARRNGYQILGRNHRPIRARYLRAILSHGKEEGTVVSTPVSRKDCTTNNQPESEIRQPTYFSRRVGWRSGWVANRLPTFSGTSLLGICVGQCLPR